MFTYAYSQPESYHFCQDSVLAPLVVAQDLRDQPRAKRALDVCAGCGVMGFELMHALGAHAPEHFDFLEIQNAFHDHFVRNQDITGSREHTRWLNTNYTTLIDKGPTYDVIIANPPYFERGEGTLSSNDINNRARFFLDSDLSSLLKSVRAALVPKGRAYLLMKSGKKHGRDAFTRARIELFDCDVTRLADIRGTDLIRIIS